ncbi:MAG TPA: outer-membrane lipoprotein carrier protein LolA [Bacillota bacterium]|nr:outer-membrane lipoprotein carrier protein LolA [Bacillota bacterium]
MYRRIVCVFVIVCVVFTGCGIIKPEMNFEKAGKKLLGLSAYTCDVTMRVTNNISTMEYKLKHFYKSPDKYRVEVIAPKELQGQVTIFNGKSSYIYHPEIDQYLVTENFSGSVEYNAFAGSFMNHIKKAEDIKVSSETEGEKKLIVLEFEMQESNNYMRFEKIWFDAEAIVPVKAEICGSDGKVSVEIYYDNFVCNPRLKDGDFDIIQKDSKKA